MRTEPGGIYSDALDRSECAPSAKSPTGFAGPRGMKRTPMEDLGNATNLDRKSGVAQWGDPRFSLWIIDSVHWNKSCPAQFS